MKFIQEIKNRKIRKWLAIYVSTAITTIGVVHLLSIRYSLPAYLFDLVFFTLLFGIASVLVAAWYHGEEGTQKFKKLEITFQIIIITALIVFLFFNINFKPNVKDYANKTIVAVLPFDSFNDSEENQFFADGITEDILTHLSKVSGLKVISRTSVMKYKNTKMNIQDIAKELGAGTILEGSVRTNNNTIRIVSQLIDSNSDSHLWAETYDRKLEDIFSIQTEIAEKISAALNITLLPIEKEQIETRSTDNIEAYTFYLKGKQHYYNYTEEENEKAIVQFKKALEVDSNYALAIAGLSDAYSQKVTKFWADKKWIDSSLVLAKKAVKINPNLPEAYKALASAYQGKDEINLAIINYKKAIEFNPNYWTAILNYGQLKMFAGFYDEALYWIRRANELAPDDIMGNISVAMVYKDLNCYNSAINWAKKAISLDPKHAFANSYLGDLYLNSGNFINARKYFENSIKIDSNWVFGWFLAGRIEASQNNYEKAKLYFDKYMTITNTYPEYFYAQALLKLNQIDTAKFILDEEVKDYSTYFAEEENVQIFNYMAFAEIYAIRNDKQNSFKWWREAINKGYTDINRVKIYPYFENLRTEPEYKKLLKKMQTKIDSFRIITERKYPEYFDCQLLD